MAAEDVGVGDRKRRRTRRDDSEGEGRAAIETAILH